MINIMASGIVWKLTAHALVIRVPLAAVLRVLGSPIAPRVFESA